MLYLPRVLGIGDQERAADAEGAVGPARAEPSAPTVAEGGRVQRLPAIEDSPQVITHGSQVRDPPARRALASRRAPPGGGRNRRRGHHAPPAGVVVASLQPEAFRWQCQLTGRCR